MSENDIIHVCMHCFSVKDWTGEYNDNMIITPEMQDENKFFSHGCCHKCLEKHYGITHLDSQVHKAEKIADEEAVR